MKKIVSVFIILFMGVSAFAQLLSWDPEFATDGGNITITLDPNFGNKALLGYNTNDIYVHTGVITNLSTTSSDWRYVRNFGYPNVFVTAAPELKAVDAGGGKVKFTINNIRNYYGVPGGETILKISILFRNGNGSIVQRNADGSDMYVAINQPGLQTRLAKPFRQPTFNPIAEPIIKNVGEAIDIEGKASAVANMRLLFNGVQVAALAGVTTIAATPNIAQAGSQRIICEAEANGTTVRDTIDFFVAAPTQIEALPQGAADGINYNQAGTSATLVLYAPNKSNVVVIGDFNDWTPATNFQMKRTPDNLRYWITLNGLTPGAEYAYQYLIDGQLKVADYNAEKVLDPWNDPFINEAPYTDKYPGLKPYPTGKTSGIVSVLEPGKAIYSWQNNSFQRPDKRNVIAYELLVRDFAARRDFKTLIDTLPYLARLGINAISLMPFNEFEGNNSWGYNPSFMFAVDKYYGPENKLREFIDSCHGRGIAVIMDMVLNHQFGQSPLAQMYWDGANNRPAPNNPWLNPVPKHGFNVGYDMNHEAPATIEFVERVMKHWLLKYKLDGFRWDLSKGFTQTQTCTNEGGGCDIGAWSAYDQSRVNIWQRIYNQSQAISPNCYMILEHLGVDQEEATLANMGMLLWGKMTNEYNQASMGYSDDSDFGRSFHTTRWSAFGGNNTPHLMAYAESHDEERLAWKNVRFGNNSNGNHNTRTLSVYTRRMQAVAGFLFTVPGPKLMWQFGELAYDSSINTCENLTLSNDCRTAPKPPAWAMPTLSVGVTQDYNSASGGNGNFRRPLRDMYSRLISLRTKYPQYLPAFVTNDVDYSLTGYFKSQRIRSNALNMVVIGNFDVNTVLGGVTFPSAGTWYVYAHNIPGNISFGTINAGLTSTSITVAQNSLAQNFNLPAGGFILFTDREITAAVTTYTFTGNGNWDVPENWQNGLIPPATLPPGSQIFINPAADGECILNINQVIQAGASLTVNPGKRLRITGNLNRQ